MKDIKDTHLSDLIGSKISKIEFSQRPILDYSSLDDELFYEVDGGTIKITLDSGVVIYFGNSEWGGMTIGNGLDLSMRTDLNFKDYNKDDLCDKLYPDEFEDGD